METMKVIQALHKDDYNPKTIYPLVKEAEKCFQESFARKRSRNTHKETSLYHLSKYVSRKK